MHTALLASTALFAVLGALASGGKRAPIKRRLHFRLTRKEINRLHDDRGRRQLSFEEYGPIVGLPFRTLHRVMTDRDHVPNDTTAFVIRQYLTKLDGDGKK